MHDCNHFFSLHTKLLPMKHLTEGERDCRVKENRNGRINQNKEKKYTYFLTLYILVCTQVCRLLRSFRHTYTNWTQSLTIENLTKKYSFLTFITQNRDLGVLLSRKLLITFCIYFFPLFWCVISRIFLIIR